MQYKGITDTAVSVRIFSSFQGNIKILQEAKDDRLYNLLNHATMCLISQAAGKGEYILTGLEVYLYREPCLMCAMALSHSRIAKLFFIENNPLRQLI